jgi:hypothetical protein
MPVMRIAVVANIRFPPTPEDTVLLASQAIRQAGIEGADIICFPEAYVPGYARSTDGRICAGDRRRCMNESIALCTRASPISASDTTAKLPSASSPYGS